MKTLFGNSCAKGCLVYFVALVAIVAITTMGLGGLKGRFSVDAQQPQGSILTTGGSQPVGDPPSDVVGGGTLPTMEPLPPMPTAQPPVQSQPTLVAPSGPTVPAGPIAFTPIPSQGGIISGESVAPFYIVQSGDTLWEIALKFGVTVDMLRAANNLTGNVIQLGQVLYLPQTVQPQLQPPSQSQPTAMPTVASQPLPQIGTDPLATPVIPFMPNTGIVKDGTP